LERNQQQFSRSVWLLLLISGVFFLSVGLSNTFVNIFVWKVDRNFLSIGLYNLWQYCIIPLAFIVAGWIAKRTQPAVTLRIGITLHAIFYAIVLFVGNLMASKPSLLGAIMGLAAGFYWFSFNVLSLHVVEGSSRDKFYGFNGVVGAIAGVIAPPVAGYLISREDRLGGLTGYHVIFGISFALFILAIILSLKMHTSIQPSTLQLKLGLFALRDKPWRSILIGCSLYGLREGVFLFLIALLFYIATGSELKLGEFVLIQSGVSFVAFYVVGRFTKDSNRIVVMAIGAVLMACSALLYLLPIQTGVVLAYGIAISLSLPLFLVPLQTYVFNGITRLSEHGHASFEHIIIREVFENIGRVIGICVFLGVTLMFHQERAIGIFAVVLGFVQLGTWIFIYSGTRHEKNQFDSLNGRKHNQAKEKRRWLTKRKAGI